MLKFRVRALAAAIAVLYPVLDAHATNAAEPATNNAPLTNDALKSGESENKTTTSAQTGISKSAQAGNQPQAIDAISVVAQRLKEARINLSPKVGTSVYSIDESLIDALGRGAATPFDEVLLRLPGVDKDSKASGSLHVRDDHGNVQYRVNGVQLPENISGFGTAIDSRYVSKLDFITGTLPAQYGLRTAGIVEIQTREGNAKPGGQVGFLFGGNHSFEPSAQLFGTSGALTFYLSGSYVANNYGIEFPTRDRNNPHDQTRQAKSFGNFSYYLGDDTRLGFLFGTYNGRFQIPVNANQVPAFSLTGFSNADTGISTLPSSQLNQNQTEVNRFFVGTLQRSIGALDFQVSAFHQYSNLHYKPDPQGDLIYLGTASDTLRSNDANGVQLDSAYRVSKNHTVRFGGGYTQQKTVSNNSVGVFPVDADGNQASPDPLTVIDNSSQVGKLLSVYLQDEWQIGPNLTMNYGARFDKVKAFINEQQLSPRLNIAYQLTPTTAIHAGYSRYFTPPPQELASQQSIALYNNTTNQASVPVSENVKSERTHYYDIGVVQKISPNLTLTTDFYYKKIRNLVDEGQFGAALILSPFNYEQGYARGIEVAAIYTEKQFTSYLNLAYQKAQGKNIISGQGLFSPDKLAYISNNYIYLDHDQTYTVSTGASYKFGDNQVSADAILGSGLRRTGDDNIPNGQALPHYGVVNTTYAHTWKLADIGEVQGRVGVLNAFDKSYQLRDGTGVGVGAPQFAIRRTFFGALSLAF
jgi:outer membrane receptor protein involved in Fe transport